MALFMIFYKGKHTQLGGQLNYLLTCPIIYIDLLFYHLYRSFSGRSWFGTSTWWSWWHTSPHLNSSSLIQQAKWHGRGRGQWLNALTRVSDWLRSGFWSLFRQCWLRGWLRVLLFTITCSGSTSTGNSTKNRWVRGQAGSAMIVNY